jgi:hypothetical protein
MSRHLWRLVCASMIALTLTISHRVGADASATHEHFPCMAHAESSSTKPATTLSWNHRRGELVLNGIVHFVDVRELDCVGYCVAPGKSGNTRFLFWNKQLTATLSLRLHCATDAEVCPPWGDGIATLRINRGGRTIVQELATSYCEP